ncbi:MAG: OmpA family protein [Ktedonobacteraceae bacterium]|nr:OmpA family protein [Ktedonobacteraceae bacterium]MBA3913038.1 OmpA family protein [Terriglobales bacterium]
MEDQSNSDHLNSSMTDLMTSLMVIFILLLLVFVHRTAGKDAAVTDVLLKRLRYEMTPQGFSEQTIRPDPRDRNAILVIVPDRLMNFQAGQSNLRPEGETFLKKYIPDLAGVLCSDQFRSSIESIEVEGHTDTQPYVGHSAEESQGLNLKLSQDRSMVVVKNALADLSGTETKRGCFLEKLSASGRGEQDQEATPDESRRVILKIRVKVVDAAPLRAEVQ